MLPKSFNIFRTLTDRLDNDNKNLERFIASLGIVLIPGGHTALVKYSTMKEPNKKLATKMAYIVDFTKVGLYYLLYNHLSQ